MKDSIIFYCSLFDNSDYNEGILISKFKRSYLIGPIINKNFDKESFLKRIKSNCIYDISEYKKVSMKKSIQLINKYKDYLHDNEIIELNGKKITKYTILKVPGDNYV